MRPSLPFVVLDDASPGQEKLKLFTNPVSLITAVTSAEVEPALVALDAKISQGKYLAGYFSYELGYLLEKRLASFLPQKRNVPLLWFGVFENCRVIEGDDASHFLQSLSQGRAYAGPLSYEWNEAAYNRRFASIHDKIKAGDIYQANLSQRSRFPFLGDAAALYLSLRQNSLAAHGAYIDDGERQILSLSPELFFDLSADGKITARPMKGTAPRASEEAEDERLRQQLANSEKDRAENLMIVDLLRNDLGRIAETGSVTVEKLFEVETYPTVHQLVSTISAQLKKQITAEAMLRALFPCGSVTGAPKIRAMEIIRAREASPRGIYCGAIGYFAADGSASFNVAIRTLTLSKGKGELGIGGAIVYDSQAKQEHEECLLKARYFERTRTPLELIETLRFEPSQGFTRLNLHLARMAASAQTFGFAFDDNQARRALEAAVNGKDTSLRVRLTLNESGNFLCTAVSLGPVVKQWRYAISPLRVNSRDEILQHKTTWRTMYDEEQARLAAEVQCDEIIFLNERGEMTEGSRSNIFARFDSELVTPPLACGLLNGCLRHEMLKRGECEERVLTPADLDQAQAVYFGNSLRGLIEAVPTNSKQPLQLAG